MRSMFELKVFQDEVNRKFLHDLEYMLKISPEKANDHYDTCLSVSYNEFRHYPNYWACRKGLSMVIQTKVWGYLN